MFPNRPRWAWSNALGLTSRIFSLDNFKATLVVDNSAVWQVYLLRRVQSTRQVITVFRSGAV